MKFLVVPLLDIQGIKETNISMMSVEFGRRAFRKIGNIIYERRKSLLFS